MKHRALTPILVALGAAAVVAVGMIFGPHWFPRMVRVVACYDAAVLTMLIWHWKIILQYGSEATRVRAATQDPGRDAVFVLALGAVGIGFVAAFDILGRGPNDRLPAHDAVVYALGFGAVVMGWLLIHTMMSFRYAHLFYSDRNRDKQIDRGLKFPADDEPDYADLAYFSFVVGMTFQVSDVQVTGKGLRRLVLAHGLISFAYSTAIIALVVNIVSGLLH